MNRHSMRLGLIFSVYQHLLLNKDLFEQAENNLGGNLEEEDRFYANEVINDLIDNETHYITLVKPLLNNWSFERLNIVEQAIILVAVSELKLGIINKAIVINEAIKIAKIYADDKSYQFINGVLDNLC